jgi:amino acid transporter
MFKKIFVFLSFVMFATITVAVFTAQASNFGLGQTASVAGYDQSKADISSTVQTVVSIVLGALSLIFFALTLYGGLTWLTARGKDEKVTEAKATLEAAIVGLIIAVGAYAISTFVFDALQSRQSIGVCICGDKPAGVCTQFSANQKPSDCNVEFCGGTNSTFFPASKSCADWDAGEYSY